ncbi:hypothetical protein BDZ45DRAFT_778629 [Acephala macrosclerotiorum]|nr:hypothetical protein BDZ45DRAFT_778629 [Acephala macrosclerotiorum]
MTPSCLILFLSIRLALAQSPIYGVSIPLELSYLLPQGYTVAITDHFIDTKASNTSINAIFTAAQNATFYAFGAEFYSIVGPSPTILKMNTSNSTFDYTNSAGVWLPDRNEIWFTGSGGSSQPYYILDLSTYTISPPNTNVTSPPALLTGADYFKDLVYLAGFGFKAPNSTSPAIHSVDPVTGVSTVVVGKTVLDSYFGVRLNNIDDLTWVASNSSSGSTSCIHPGEDNLFFTTLDTNARSLTPYSSAVLLNAVFRYTPSTHSLQSVISRGGILALNVVHIDNTGCYLYFTDVAATLILFAMPRSGYADGIKIDRFGRM